MSTIRQLAQDLTIRQKMMMNGPPLLPGSGRLVDRLDSLIGDAAFALVPVYYYTYPDEGSTGTYGLLAADGLMERVVFVGNGGLEFEVRLREIESILPYGTSGQNAVMRATGGPYFFDPNHRAGTRTLLAILPLARQMGIL